MPPILTPASIADLGGGGTVTSVAAGTGIDVDATNPAAPSVAIEPGVYRSGGTDVAVADGGTGASTAAAARTALGLVIGTDVPPVANPTFTGNVVVPDADAATEAMNRQASDARYALLPVWAAYTPALTAVTTNPTLGVASIAAGRFCQIGKFVRVEVHIKFGTSGTAAGSGEYRVSLPVTAVSPLRTGGSVPIGIGWVFDSSASALSLINVEQLDTTKVHMRQGGAGAQVATHLTPFAWAASDEIVMSFSYEAA